MGIEDKEHDAVYERSGALFEKLGISESSYARILEASIVHASTAPAPDTDPAWIPVGPRNLGGRIMALAQHPDFPNTIFAGSAHGGLWRSIDRGDTWERLGKPGDVFPLGALAMPRATPTVLYAGTGSPLQDYVSGRGLYRVLLAGTINGTATFEPLAGVPVEHLPPVTVRDGAAFRYTRIRVDPDDSTRFWAASQTGLWRCEVPVAPGSVPVFTREFPDKDNEPADAKLVDDFSGGISWPAYCTDVLVSHDPRDDEEMEVSDGGNKKKARRYLILYVAISGKGIWRGRFDRKGPETSFESKKLSMPGAALGTTFTRVRLAQCERRPEHVCAVMATTADDPSEVFRSSDNGDSWTKGKTRIPGTGQAEYDLVLECSPDDPKVVVCGGVELALSEDGGDNWSHILDSSQHDKGDEGQHADQHIAMFDVADNRKLWVGNDGGLSLARDLRAPVQSAGYWRKRSQGIFAGQFQDVTGNPFHAFVSGGGLQDNGSWVSYGGLTWYAADGGDGGMMAVDHVDPHQLFSTWQGSAGSLGIDVANAVPFDQPAGAADSDLLRVSLADIPASIAPGHVLKFRTVDVSPPNGPLFVGIIEQHPTIAGELIVGRIGGAFGTVNRGAAWTSLLGPLGVGVGGVGATEEISAVAFGPVDGTAIPAGVDGWIGTDRGKLFQTTTASAGPWAVATALPWPGGQAQVVSRIVVHPHDRRIVAVSSAGRLGRVFITFDRGTTWVDITEPIPTGLTITAPVGTLQVGHTVRFIAMATYASGVPRDVTADVDWRSSVVANAKVGDTTLTKGHVTGVAPGATTISATWTIGVAGPPPATRGVTVVAKTSNPLPAPAPPVRQTHRNALPASPITSLIFDAAIAAGAPQVLLAGTLAGVFALPAVPAVSSLAISPGGPLVRQANAPALPLSCIATYSDGTTRDVTTVVDWSVVGAGPTIGSAAGTHGSLNAGPTQGDFTVRAARGTIPPATAALKVQAGVAPAPAGGAVPGITPPPVPIGWRPFGRRMPLALVTDMARMGQTTRLRAATFGLGVFECDTGPGVRKHQLFIRQTVIEDGRTYPRAIPTIPPAGVQLPSPPPPPPPLPPAAPLNDPRLPQTGPRAVPLDFTHAFDIRVDAPPYTFFDDVIDGVEFDETLEIGDPIPTEINYVYVQVHNVGTEPVGSVTLHLYAAECDAIAPIGTSPATVNAPATLDAAAPIADFYGRPSFDPIADSKWKRVDTATSIATVSPGVPVVTRFTWVPDAALATKHAALLAVCSGPDKDHDALPDAAAGAPVSAFIVAERRAALRILRVAARPAASLFIRDGMADDTRVGGYPVAGRSPDIMVVHPDINQPASEVFKDFLARRTTDSVSSAVTNVVYVRVHNLRKFDTAARVKVYAIGLDDGNRPSSDLSVWKDVPPDLPPILPGFPPELRFAEVDVLASGVAYARIELPAAADPNPGGTNKTYLLLALIKSADDTDLLPTKESVDSADTFWELVSRYVDSDNAAGRAVPWV